MSGLTLFIDILSMWILDYIEHLMQKMQDATAILLTITEIINMLFAVVSFLKYVPTEVVLFSIVAFKTLTFHKVVTVV